MGRPQDAIRFSPRVPRSRFRTVVLLGLALLLAWAPFAAAEGENTVDTGQLPDSSFVYEAGIHDLQTSGTQYEGQTVQITGEVVGDIINDEDDPDRRWITVDSLPGEQAASIQVYITADQAQLIDTLGRYQVTGSTVSVIGRFHLVCSEHDGLTDLHADSLSVTHPGSRQAPSFPAGDFIPAAALATAGLALFVFYRRKREELQ